MQFLITFVMTNTNRYCHYYYYYYYYYYFASCHRPFLPGTSLELTVIPTIQASRFRLQYVVCYVLSSSIAVFCSEFIDCFRGMASKCFLKPFITIPATPVITCIILLFRFQIRSTSIHKLLYFSFSSACWCVIFLPAGIATSTITRILSFLFSIIISGLLLLLCLQ